MWWTQESRPVVGGSKWSLSTQLGIITGLWCTAIIVRDNIFYWKEFLSQNILSIHIAAPRHRRWQYHRLESFENKRMKMRIRKMKMKMYFFDVDIIICTDIMTVWCRYTAHWRNGGACRCNRIGQIRNHCRWVTLLKSGQKYQRKLGNYSVKQSKSTRIKEKEHDEWWRKKDIIFSYAIFFFYFYGNLSLNFHQIFHHPFYLFSY